MFVHLRGESKPSWFPLYWLDVHWTTSYTFLPAAPTRITFCGFSFNLFVRGQPCLFSWLSQICEMPGLSKVERWGVRIPRCFLCLSWNKRRQHSSWNKRRFHSSWNKRKLLHPPRIPADRQTFQTPDLWLPSDAFVVRSSPLEIWTHVMCSKSFCS